MISIINGYYKYGDNVVFNNLNLEIEEGKITAIIGNNGSGKTTLSYLLSGLLFLKDGTITIDKLNINKKTKSIDIRKKISIVMQNPDNFIIFDKVRDEIEFTLKNMFLKYNEEIIANILRQVKMDKYIDSNPYEMSQGQKQKIAIASALSVNSKYLVFDEITASLDSKSKDDIYKMIINLNKKGKTIIFTTNVIEEIIYANNVIILNDNEPIIIDKEALINNIDILRKLNFNIPLQLELLNILIKKGVKVKYNCKSILNSVKDLL